MSKKEKKSADNLVNSEKSGIFAPEMSKITSRPRFGFVTPWNYQPVFEHVDSTPSDALKHNEALSIRDILVRSSRGQRLNVNTRMRSEGVPDNMYTEEELKKYGHETIHDAPPDDINDIVDVYAYQEELAERRAELEKKHKKDRRERRGNGEPAAGDKDGKTDEPATKPNEPQGE